MRPFRQVVLLAFCSLLVTPSVTASAAPGIPLASVARSAHLQYDWLAAARAVQLSGPGIVLVIRPGDYLYDVNDRVEVASVAPYYASNDIYVTPALANHITSLARQALLAESAQEARFARAAAIEANQERTESIAGATQGTIVLNATQLRGAEAVLITGEAPPSAPVLITLLATLSSELPNILLSRHQTIAGPDGKFQAILPIAPDYWRSTFIHVMATSSPGVTPASAQLLVQEPNAGVKVPADAFPGGIW
jgi:hypothetical protein